jgi:hypothetical protein
MILALWSIAMDSTLRENINLLSGMMVDNLHRTNPIAVKQLLTSIERSWSVLSPDDQAYLCFVRLELDPFYVANEYNKPGKPKEGTSRVVARNITKDEMFALAKKITATTSVEKLINNYINKLVNEYIENPKDYELDKIIYESEQIYEDAIAGREKPIDSSNKTLNKLTEEEQLWNACGPDGVRAKIIAALKNGCKTVLYD